MTSQSKIFLFVIVAVVAVAAFWVWTGYNGFVTAHEGVDAMWAQVETQYQRRADLIPNLVNTVKGAAEFEQGTFVEVTEARTKWMGAQGRGDQMEAAQGMDSALARLLLTFENYPDLKATKAYTDLMAQLEGTENRVAVARRDFNESVRGFNVLVKRFPGNMLAGFFGFAPEAFFESDEGTEDAPIVDFE
ncbi:MAG: LemA family protein [Patescibacteria group bacterium]